MASEYCRSVLKICVAQICQNLGWNSTQSTPLELLTDVLERYILQLGNVSHRYCEQFGRTDVNLDDVGLAFQQLGINLDEITEYVTHVEPIPFAKETVAFPAPKRNNLQFPNPRSREILQHRDEHIPDHLPHMFPGGQDDVEESSPNETIGLAPEFTSPEAVSPAATDSKSTVTSADGPPSKRPRISSATLPAEADPSQYEMMSVIMTQEGELTPKRQGKLPDSRTPPAGCKQALFREAQPSPLEQLKEKAKEKYSESEKEKSDIDVVYDSDNKSNNNSDKLNKSKNQDKIKKLKSKSKLSKDGQKKKIGNSAESSKTITTEKNKKKHFTKDVKLLKNKIKKNDKDGRPKKTSKEPKLSKGIKREQQSDSNAEDIIMASIQMLKDPDGESSNSQGYSPDRLVIASESDMKEKEKSARLATVDDCIDAVIRQSVADGSPEKEKLKEETGELLRPKQEVLDSFDETIASVVGQSSKDIDSASIEIKTEIESDQQSSSTNKNSTEIDEKRKKKRKPKDSKLKSTNKDKGVREKLKKKLISKSLSTIAKKPVIPALPDKYLTDEMKVFAFMDSPERPEIVVKEEVVKEEVVHSAPEDPVSPVSVPAFKPVSIKHETVAETSDTPVVPPNKTPPEHKDSEQQPSTADNCKAKIVSDTSNVEKIKIEDDNEKKSKDKTKSKEHKKDKKDRKDKEKYKDKDKKKKRKKDKDRDRDKDRDKDSEKDVKERSKERKKEKEKLKLEKSDKSEKKSKESKDEVSTPNLPRLKINFKLGGTPISSTSVLSSPKRSVSDRVGNSPKLDSAITFDKSADSPSVPKLVIKPFAKQAEDQKVKEEKQKLKEEKQKLKEVKREEKRLKEEKEKEIERQREIEKQKESEREKEKAQQKERELELERKKKEEKEKEKERERQRQREAQKELETKLKLEAEEQKKAEKKRLDDEFKEKQRKQKDKESAKIAKVAKKLMKKQLTEPLPPKSASPCHRSRSPTPPTVPASPASSTHSSPQRMAFSPASSPVRTSNLKSPVRSPVPISKPSPATPVKTPSRGRGRPPKNKNSPKVVKPSPRRYSPRAKSPESPLRTSKSEAPVSPASDDIVLDSSSGVVAETVGTFVQDAAGNQIWICPACKMQDDGSPMIGCDNCPDWYHWVCVNIVQEPPEDDEWFCPRCRQNKKLKPKLKKKRKKKVIN